MGGCPSELHRKSMCALLQPCCRVPWGYYILGERLVLLGWFGLTHSLGQRSREDKSGPRVPEICAVDRSQLSSLYQACSPRAR